MARLEQRLSKAARKMRPEPEWHVSFVGRQFRLELGAYLTISARGKGGG